MGVRGMFDDVPVEETPLPQAQPIPPSVQRVPVVKSEPVTPVTAKGMFEDAPSAPMASPDPNAVDWSRLNAPLGELKPSDQSYTEAAKSKGQDILMAGGMEPYRARHLAEGAVGIAGFTPLGSALSGADLTYHLPRGQYGHAALDVLGTIPGAMQVRRGVQAARGTLPMTRMADTPTLPELRDYKNAKYFDVGTSPVQYHPQAGSDYVSRARQILESPQGGGFSPEKAAELHATLNRFERAMEARGSPVSAADFDTLRSQLRGLPGASGAGGNRAIDILDRYMFQPPAGAVIHSPPGALGALQRDINDARMGNRAYRTAKEVGSAIDYAGTKADIVNSGLNQGNKTLQGLGAFVTSDAGAKRIPGALPAEREAILAFTKGDPRTNIARAWGNRLGGGGGIGQTMIGGGAGAGGGSFVSHALGLDPVTGGAVGMALGAAPMVAGRVARNIANERTVRAAEEVAASIRRNSPLYAERARATPDIVDPAAMTRDAIAYALIPQLKRRGESIWDEAHVPYANR